MSSTPPTAFAFTAWGRRRAGSVTSDDSGSIHDSRGRHRSISSMIPPREAFHSQDGRSHQHQHQNQQQQQLLSSSLASTSHREPIRSFINPAQRDYLAPVSSQLHARSVREDTAELATYQLADKTERQNSSILARNRSLSFHTTFSSDVEADDCESPTTANTSNPANWGPEPIEETSEPEPSPSTEGEDRQLGEGEGEGEGEEDTDETAFGQSPSLLTRALRRSPPHTPGGAGPSDQQQEEESNQQQQQPSAASRNGAYRGRIYRIQGTHGRERSDSNAVFSDADEDGDDVRPGGAKRAQVRLSSSAVDGPSQAPTESTPLLGNSVAANGSADQSAYDLEGQKKTIRRRILNVFGRRQGQEGNGNGPARSPTIVVKDKIKKTYRSVKDLKWWDRRRLWENVVVAPVACLPAVIVGLLLNILDALSYGMILFPLGNPIFAHLGAAGISIFYVSTIASQIVFSSGSIFRGGIGSELIEVVPFFHSMALTITDIVGEESPDAVIATTITSYALSAMVTGTVFYLMGHFKFGYIVGFIPRHILIGCIGGVGWFLIATGFEVTARIDGSLEYDLDTLKKLMQPDTVPLWIIPLTLAIVLFYGQKHITNKYFLPLYIITIPFIFYLVALVGGTATPEILRNDGWVFQGPPADEPWWYFYTLYSKCSHTIYFKLEQV